MYMYIHASMIKWCKVDWIGYPIHHYNEYGQACFCVGFPQLDNYHLNFSLSGQGMGGIAAFPIVVPEGASNCHNDQWSCLIINHLLRIIEMYSGVRSVARPWLEKPQQIGSRRRSLHTILFNLFLSEPILQHFALLFIRSVKSLCWVSKNHLWSWPNIKVLILCKYPISRIQSGFSIIIPNQMPLCNI